LHLPLLDSSRCVLILSSFAGYSDVRCHAQVLQQQPQDVAAPDAASNAGEANTSSSTGTAGSTAAVAMPGEAPQLVEYVVTVHTGTALGAGTDGDVFLALSGERGSLGERQLTSSSTHTNKFERGEQASYWLGSDCVLCLAMHACRDVGRLLLQLQASVQCHG
jgi:hypothetical protein